MKGNQASPESRSVDQPASVRLVVIARRWRMPAAGSNVHHELVWFEIDVDGGEERTFAKGMMDRKETDYLLSGAQ